MYNDILKYEKKFAHFKQMRKLLYFFCLFLQLIVYAMGGIELNYGCHHRVTTQLLWTYFA